MTVILLGIFFISVAAMGITRYFELEKWQVSIGLLVLAIVLYLVNITLIQLFIKKRAPDFASSDEVTPGVQAWELTAGLGIVPKWVSWIGLLAISAFTAAVLPWVIGAMNLVFSR